MIPREIAAFAAGISATGMRNFHVIAASIAALGMGTYDQAALRLAVQDWSREKMRTHDEAQRDVVDAVDRTRSGPSS